MKEKVIFLDTETTGLEEPGMIQLGYIVCDLNFKEIKRENMFFDTEKDIELSAMSVHHITREILATKLKEDTRTDEEKIEIAQRDFEDAYLIAHNSPFDKGVLDNNGVITQDDSWIDSHNIAYARYEDKDMKYGLQYLRYYFECTFDEVIDAHDALSDVIVLKSVFQIIFGEYKEKCLVGGYEPENSEFLKEMMEETQKGIILRYWIFGKYKGEAFADIFKRDPGYFKWMYNKKKEDGNTNDSVFNTIKFYLQEND